LRSKLKKDKRLSSNPSIQSAISKIFASNIARTSEDVAAKLESRLLSSKLLSKEVNLVISSLYSALKQGEDDDGDDDTSSHSNEAHLVDLAAVVNQPVTSEVSEDNSGDSEDDTSGTSDSVENDEPFQRSTPTLPKNFRSALDRTSHSHSPRLPDDASQSMGTESAFFPSLSNGFIPGGSDTDLSDGEARATAGIRKNRRGQRARRA
jgi:BUD22